MEQMKAEKLVKKLICSSLKMGKIYEDKEQKSLDRALYLGFSMGYYCAARDVYVSEGLGGQMDFPNFRETVRRELAENEGE